MKYVFEVSDNEGIRLKILNDDGSTARDIPRVLRVADACRWLGRSRRHLYRYVKRGWLTPVAKFSGELFFEEKDYQYFVFRAKNPIQQSTAKSKWHVLKERILIRLKYVISS